MKPDPRFVKGLELFNEGQYFECHEVIEDLWLETPYEDFYRDFYKGVIQAAAAVYQSQRGILTGARGLSSSSLKYLEKYAPDALGLNVAKLIADLRAWDAEKSEVPLLEYEAR
ncbi:MAG TPA: DUF309 domain-containing protein [Candidatus Eisenbacteria bacterium]|jgi:predicted metal-dependent hydrolase|nr:DUF309 domain-containing protein [Candidatus Eisenbacteria bacterium]